MEQTVLPQQPPPHSSGNAGECWLAAMRAGDFPTAWAISDAVLAARDPACRDDPALPYHLRWVWDGTPPDGRHVLVRCYHGLGDTLQFCRYLAPLRRRAASVTLEVQPELRGLLCRLPGVDRLIPFDAAAPAPRSACDIEIMELGHVLRLPPSPAPYLSASPLVGPAPGLHVGLCWHVASTWQPERSLPLARLASLGGIPGVALVSLQRGPGAAELQQAGAPAMAHDVAMDMQHTARLVAGLDLVVTIDTMVAHLAGALGRPVWLLLQAEPDWRWLAGGNGSPWYGSVRKYRQPATNEWDGPVSEVHRDLTRLAGGMSLPMEPGGRGRV